ncbi:isoprenylcysteine carboxylmethyltransferase family protein [Rhizobium sp. GN54]|nr:isoprenylcysteine carboxylmethyltransferase family protein [Rhizobium sp. GN54]
MEPVTVTIGNFFFRFRNQVFPLVILALFLMRAPALPTVDGDTVGRLREAVALLSVFCGLGLRALVIGYAYIRRGGRNRRVYAKNLVTEGMFGVCRNPLYVGNMLLYFGLFLFHGNPAVVVTGTCLFFFIYHCIVFAEEDFLSEKFGDAYDRYRADVPRWWMRWSNFAEATQGMRFSLLRVLAKDYSTIAAATFAVIATEIYRIAFSDVAGQRTRSLVLLALAMLAAGVATAVISYLKRSGALEEA